MSLLRTIKNLNTGTYLVTRRGVGTFVDGIYVPAATTTFSITATVEPASGFSRVVGGKDWRSQADGEHVDEVRAMYTATQLYTRTPTSDPDYVTIEGAQWLAMRIEQWTLKKNTYWRVILTKETFGGS